MCVLYYLFSKYCNRQVHVSAATIALPNNIACFKSLFRCYSNMFFQWRLNIHTVVTINISSCYFPFPLFIFLTILWWSAVIQVRIFSAANVRQELQESLRDYVQASVGISDRGKLLIPKLLQSYAKGNVEDSLLADWICHHLTPDQVAVIRDSSSQRKQRLLGARSFTVVAFDSKFRYLFLPDSSGSQKPEPKRTSWAVFRKHMLWASMFGPRTISCILDNGVASCIWCKFLEEEYMMQQRWEAGGWYKELQ